ncbi:taurine transport system substrate-binding domain protein [Acinetobacter baumannii 21072]|uniref:Taurine transport system substrate-binding domain protein n=1 Tax=Acinetobacter baumannii 21072 TaxID=1310697 RepID=A0A062IB87_ACIBA|nr:taurine transport system substrate-binding domain protein [Acinetobacter baumannii 21072]
MVNLRKIFFDTAKFLKGQGKVDQLKADYKGNVNSSFLQP